MATLLIAAREEEQATFQRELGLQHRLRFCSSLQSAVRQLDSDVDAILCSPHFDDGQLFELLELARLQADTRRTPLYAVVIQSRHFSRHFVAGLESALDLMGGQGVLDLAGWRRELGEAQARQKLRRAVANIADSAARPVRHLSREGALLAA